ncbi:MAG: PAS domain S-box protein [Pyrinomonadaceae bacterium]
MSSLANPHHRYLRITTRAAGAFAALGGLMSTCGWIFDIDGFRDPLRTAIEIKANTAIVVMLAGISLILLSFSRRFDVIVRILGAVVFGVAFLTLLQHLTGLDFRIDTLLFHDSPGGRGDSVPGRMGMPASTSLSCIGAAVILCTFGTKWRRIAGNLGIVSLFIASLSLVGYLFGANQLYSVAIYTGIALQTALFIAILGIGIAAEVPEAGFVSVLIREDAGGLMFRRLLIPVVLISLLLGFLRVAGQKAGLYDTEFGTALRTLTEIIILISLLWWNARDIGRSDAKARELADVAAEGEKSLGLVLKALKDSFMSVDRDMRFTYLNDSALSLFTFQGVPESEIIGSHIFDVFPQAKGTELGNALTEAMETRRTIELESYYPPFDRYFFARFIPLDNGGLSIFALDITDRKLAQLELGKLATIVETTRDAVISIDLTGSILSWNTGASKLYGYEQQEVIGKNVEFLLPKDRADEEKKILARIISGEKIDTYETTRVRKDGSHVDVSLTISPVRDADEQIIGASKIARDITMRRQADKAVRDSEIMHRIVEAQESERNRIARDLHDQLGQRLTALRLKVESARGKTNGHVALSKDLEDIQSYAADIDIDVNFLAWELRPTELDALGLRDALASFVREWSNTYNIHAEFHSNNAEGERLTPEMETNLYRIVQEGLNNILKHAGATSVNVLLDFREDRLDLIIEDNGRGFEIADDERPSPTGRLGLIGMRERTALMGGTLLIETEPGSGTTVYSRVPRNGDLAKSETSFQA